MTQVVTLSVTLCDARDKKGGPVTLVTKSDAFCGSQRGQKYFKLIIDRFVSVWYK